MSGGWVGVGGVGVGEWEGSGREVGSGSYC